MSNDEWFYTSKAGTQTGPASLSSLKQLIADGEVTKSAMVWKQGMADWSIVSQVEDLKSTEIQASAPPATTAQKTAENPYQTPSTTPDTLVDYYPEAAHSGGIGRLKYFISYIVIIAIAIAIVLGLVFSAVKLESSAGILIGVGVLLVIGLLIGNIILAGARLKNTGMNPWFALMSFVPIANIYFAWRCLAAPAGYASTKKLDTAGKVITWIFIGYFLLNIALAIFSGFSSYEESYDRAIDLQQGSDY